MKKNQIFDSVLWLILLSILFSGCGLKVPRSGTWSRQLGVAASSTYGYGITVYNSGIYVTGRTSGNLDGKTKTGTEDCFVIKYDQSGKKIWSRLLGVVSAYTNANDIGANSTGIYVVGSTDGNLDEETLNGTNDVFLTKYDASGNKQWTKLLGVASAATYEGGIAVDNSGVYITGVTNGDLDLETLTGTTDVFVTKYDSSGNKAWTKLSGVALAGTSGSAIAADSTGIYVTGTTYGNLDLESKTGTCDVFVMKYNSAGTKVWTRLSGVTGLETKGYNIAVDSTGIYVTGFTKGNLDGQTKNGAIDAFLIKYDSSGTKQWTKLLGVVSTNTCGYGVTTSSDGVYVTGYTEGNLDGRSMTGSPDAFVVKYNSSGVKQWTKLLGAITAQTVAKDIAVGNSDTFVTGYTSGGIGGQHIAGTYDVFVTNKFGH